MTKIDRLVSQALEELTRKSYSKAIKYLFDAQEHNQMSIDADLYAKGLEYATTLMDFQTVIRFCHKFSGQTLEEKIHEITFNNNFIWDTNDDKNISRIWLKYEYLGKRGQMQTLEKLLEEYKVSDPEKKALIVRDILEIHLINLERQIVSEFQRVQRTLYSPLPKVRFSKSNAETKSQKAFYTTKIELESPLRTPLQQYLNYFSDYIRDVKGIQLQFEITQTKTGLELVIENSNNITEEALQQWLNEYMNYLKTPPQEDNVIFQRSNISEEEKKRIIIELQINVEYAQRAISHRKELGQNDQLNEALVGLLPGGSNIQMGHKSDTERVRDLIAKSRLGSAMKLLFSIVKLESYQHLRKNLTALSASYYHAEEEHSMKGMMDGNDYRREMARITHALIVIVNEVEEIDKED